MRKLISLVTLVSFSIQAATITDDKLTVGKKSSASDKEIVFDTGDGSANKKIKLNKTNKKLIITSDEALIGDGTNSDKAITFDRGGSNAQVKWNEVTDKLQFSNDGTTFKDLGTGGGGGGSTGVNVLTNDSFEDAVGGVITDWSNTGGTLTQQTYTNGVEGDLKYARFVASTSGQYVETTAVAIPTSFSGGCQADFKKVNVATAGLFKIQAMDTTGATVYAEQTIGVSSWIKVPTISFPCPVAGTMVKLRLISIAAGTIDFDRGYLGSNQNLVNTIASNDTNWASCTFSSLAWSGLGTITNNNLECRRSGSSLQMRGKFTTGTVTGSNIEFPLPTNFGSISMASNVADFSPLGTVLKSGSGEAVHFAFLGRTSLTYMNMGPAIAGGVGTSPLSPQAGTAYGSATAFEILSLSIPIHGWSVITQQDIAISNEQASWFIDANIGGQNTGLSSASVSSYTEATAPALDMVINSQKGSASAEIACASGTASSGLVCNVANESIGISFIPPMAGMYEACFSFSHDANAATNSSVKTTFQVIETSNTSSAILNEGGQKTPSGMTTGSGGLTYGLIPNKVCGTFNFSDTSKKTLRLMYEQLVTGTISGSIIVADRDALSGQRDIHIIVRPLLSAYNRPILTGDQVTMNGNKNYTFVGFDVSASGVVTNADNPSIAPASCSVTSGNGTCVFPVTFANRPKCSVVIDQSSSVNQYVSRATPSGGNTLTYTTFIGSASTNSAVSIFCLVKLP